MLNLRLVKRPYAGWGVLAVRLVHVESMQTPRSIFIDTKRYAPEFFIFGNYFFLFAYPKVLIIHFNTFE